MKTKRNLFLFIAAALTNLTATAQQQEDKDFLPDGIVTVEWRFNPFDYEEKPKNMAQLNARMFLNGKTSGLLCRCRGRIFRSLLLSHQGNRYEHDQRQDDERQVVVDTHL